MERPQADCSSQTADEVHRNVKSKAEMNDNQYFVSLMFLFICLNTMKAICRLTRARLVNLLIFSSVSDAILFAT